MYQDNDAVAPHVAHEHKCVGTGNTVQQILCGSGDPAVYVGRIIGKYLAISLEKCSFATENQLEKCSNLQHIPLDKCKNRNTKI